MLGEHAVGQTALADVRMDLVGRRLPGVGQLQLVAYPGQAGAAVHRHPAHELRRREVLRIAPYLPQAAVGLPPVLQRALDLALENRPDALVEVVTRLGVDVDGVEHRPPDVVLALAMRGVADADGAGPGVTVEVVEHTLLEIE